MASRTATELRNYVYTELKPNEINAITAQLNQILFLDFIDSFVISSSNIAGVVDVSQTSTNVVPIGASLQIPLIAPPKNGAIIVLNGQTFDIGITSADRFYFTNPAGTVVRAKGSFEVGDVLNYNASALGFVIDNLDTILINYLIEE